MKSLSICGTYRTMIEKPDTFEALLSNWTKLELSQALGVPYVNARKMIERKSVNPIHWPKLIEAASGKGIALTNDDLIAMLARKAVAA